MMFERPGGQILWAVHHVEGSPISKPSCQPVGNDVPTREPKEPIQSNDKRIFENRDNLSTEAALPTSSRQQGALMEHTRKGGIEVRASKAGGNGNSETHLGERRAQGPRLLARKARGIDMRLALPRARDTSADTPDFAQAYGADTTRWVVSPSVRSIYSAGAVELVDIKNTRCYALNPVASHVWVTLAASPAGISFTGIVEVLETHFAVRREELVRAVRYCLTGLEHASLVRAMVVGSSECEVDRISLPSSDGAVGQLALEGGQTMSGMQPFVETLETLESLIDRVLPQGVKSNADPRVNQLKDAIDDEPATVNESLGHVCSRLQLSLTERQARRLFKEAAGISMREYTRKKRLVVAARQLQDADDPIKVIATNAGYHSYYGFGKAFHDMFQLTPMEFRRFWRRRPRLAID